MSLLSEASIQARQNAGLYNEVESHFTNSFFGMLLVRGITSDIASIIRDNPFFNEQDGYTFVFHIGSIKLLYNSEKGNIAVVVHTNEGGRCGVQAYIWHTEAEPFLSAEFVVVSESGSSEFRVPLPETVGHRLWEILGEIKRTIMVENRPKRIHAALKRWAAEQK